MPTLPLALRTQCGISTSKGMRWDARHALFPHFFPLALLPFPRLSLLSMLLLVSMCMSSLSTPKDRHLTMIQGTNTEYTSQNAPKRHPKQGANRIEPEDVSIMTGVDDLTVATTLAWIILPKGTRSEHSTLSVSP
jgi:hypothetical protein